MEPVFWKPGAAAPGVELSEQGGFAVSYQDRETDKEANVVVFNPYFNLSLLQQKQKLPIFQLRKQILYCVETYQVTVIVGQTGCGKSTQIPQ